MYIHTSHLQLLLIYFGIHGMNSIQRKVANRKIPLFLFVHVPVPFFVANDPLPVEWHCTNTKGHRPLLLVTHVTLNLTLPAFALAVALLFVMTLPVNKYAIPNYADNPRSDLRKTVELAMSINH